MTFIIELVFLAGFTMSVDATQMYGIDNDVKQTLVIVMLVLLRRRRRKYDEIIESILW